MPYEPVEDAVANVLPFLPACIWAALLLYIGGRSSVPAVETTLPLDKVAHFVAYGILGALATLGWLRPRRAARPPRLIWILTAALLIGAVDEWQQRGVPNRSAEFSDWLADAVGIALAASLVLRFTGQGSSNVV